MITEYEHLQNERPHIAAAVKLECSIITAFNVLQALDIQEREIQRLKEINDGGKRVSEANPLDRLVMPTPVARKGDYEFDANVPLDEARRLVKQYHYAKGASNTRTDLHGFRKNGKLVAVAWWLPPTRVACESVSKDDWKKVVSLSRLVVHPDEPKNVCSMLIGASIRQIKKDGRWLHLVTYADHAEGHTGAIYRATNWEYAGTTGPYPKWVDKDGKQTACKATKNRRKAEMEALGMTMVGRFHKEKFVMHL